ncbi:MAG: hypothetical protein N3F66_04605 [Spirochaetes bacterium]|nr:hypothetical protein [Spirochaetota bacterium]
MEDQKQINILRIGVANLSELEEIVKAFRLMNQYAKRRRFVVSREELRDMYGNIIVEKAHDINISVVKLLQRNFKPDNDFKIFSSDEGIAIVTNTESPNAKEFSLQLIATIEGIGGGIYKPFIDIVPSFYELFKLFEKGLSPKMVVVGYIPIKQVAQEVSMYNEIKKYDPYIRILDITHDELKPKSFLKGAVTFHFDNTHKVWQRFLTKLIQEYTKPYFMEQITR